MEWAGEPGLVVKDEVVTLRQVLAGAKFAGNLAFIRHAERAALVRSAGHADAILGQR